MSTDPRTEPSAAATRCHAVRERSASRSSTSATAGRRGRDRADGAGGLPPAATSASPTARHDRRSRTSRSTSPRSEITAFIGPSGLRQVDDHPLPEPDERPDPVGVGQRRGALPRRGPLRREGRPGPGAQAHRDGLPEAEPVPEVDLREHRLRPARARHEGRHGRDRRERAAARRALGRRQGPPQDERLRHVRRPAAAAVHRARARRRARRDPHGRAVLGARPDLDRPRSRTSCSSSSSTTRS